MSKENKKENDKPEIENFILPQKLDPRTINIDDWVDGMPGYSLSDDSQHTLNTCIEKCRLYGNLLVNIGEDPNLTQNALADLGAELLFIATMIREVMEDEHATDIVGE